MTQLAMVAMDVLSGFWVGALAGLVVVLAACSFCLGRKVRRLRRPPDRR